MADEKTLQFPLDGSVVVGALDEVIQPPSLTRSRNTRLSVSRGAPSKCPAVSGPPKTTFGGTGAVGTHTPIPGPSALPASLGGGVRMLDDGYSTLLDSSGDALPFVPSPREVIDAGLTMAGLSGSPACVAYDGSGRLWMVSIRQNDNTFAGTRALSAYLTVRTALGQDLVAAQYLCDIGTGTNAYVGYGHWATLTYHSTAGMCLWYNHAGGAINRRVLTLSTTAANVVTAGSAVAVYTPLATWAPCAVSGGATSAYLMCRHSSTATDCVVLQVTVSTGAVAATYTHSDDWGADSVFSLAYATGFGGAARVCAAAHDGDVIANLWHLTAALSLTTSTPIGGYTACDVCAFICGTAGNAMHGVALSPPGTTVGASDAARTFVYALDASGVVHYLDLPFVRIASPVAIVRPTSLGYPVIPVVRWHGTDSDVPSSGRFVFDPAVTLIELRPDYTATSGPVRISWGPVARLGAYVAAQSPAAYKIMGSVPSRRVSANTSGATIAENLSGDELVCTYHGQNAALSDSGWEIKAEYGRPSRFARIALTPYNPSTAQCYGSATVASGAWPMYWDGSEFGEIGHAHRPCVAIGSLGAGAVTGTFTVAAVYRWTDAAGEVHRSAPSNLLVITLASNAWPHLYVARPLSTRDNGLYPALSVDIYLAGGGLTVLRKQTPLQQPASSSGALDFDMALFTSDLTATTLYTDGGPNSELLPDAPAAIHDVTLVSERAWYVLGERRYEVGWSKPKSADLPYEFPAEFTAPVPAQGGRVQCVREASGQPFIFAERCVWTMFGEGPDALGNGAYSPAKIVAPIGCSTRNAVAMVPDGIVWLTDKGRWAKLAGGAPTIFDVAPTPDTEIVGHMRFPAQHEVVFFQRYGDQLVYNWLLDKWSTWALDLSGLGETACVGAGNVSDTVGHFLSLPIGEADADIVRVSGNGSNAGFDDLLVGPAQMSIKTGWITPGEQQTDCQFRSLTVQALRAGSHGVSVVIEYDYSTAGATTVTWTAAQVLALTGADGRYTLVAQLRTQQARAIRVEVTETDAAGNAMRPISATLNYALVGATHRRAVLPGATKG